MVSSNDKDWKSKLGFPINYDSGQSSEDEFDTSDVVMRHPRSSRFLLQESGDGAEADLLGTTPPRARIRDKEKRRNMIDSGLSYQRMCAEGKRVDEAPTYPKPPERIKKRASRELCRAKERDWKQDFAEPKADSLPSPSPNTAAPTFVECTSRYMSLSSRLKCRAAEQPARRDEQLPASRVSFHDTFSMLINMGSLDKGCRRTISREEQVWQNELKDLIWLELQARIAGRSLAQHDAFLCAQRNNIPDIVQRILNYKFVSPKSVCRSCTRLQPTKECSNEDLSTEYSEGLQNAETVVQVGCLSIECGACAEAVGAGMREVCALLDALDAAAALYPSSSAATHDHPQLADPALLNRIRAMCLWYNTALHMRLKLLSVRRMLRSMRERNRHRKLQHNTSVESACSRKSSDTRSCQVRFNLNSNTNDSNNSDISTQSDVTEEKKDSSSDQEKDLERVEKEQKKELGKGEADQKEQQEPDEQLVGDKSEIESVNNSENHDNGEENNEETAQNGFREEKADIQNSYNRSDKGTETPEIIVSEIYNTNDTSASSESGYASSEHECEDVYEIGALHDLTQLRLLDRRQVSAYRAYHYDMLKTAGVRRCMMFMNKIWSNLLHMVYHTLQEPQADDFTDEESEVEASKDCDTAHDRNTYELRRYGCWCPESIEMQLPSFRNHFLLLNCICMEALHDYLALRVDSRPDRPSCLTIKQLIHELKEGLDIAAGTRANFARNVEAALRGWQVPPTTRKELLMILKTYDATVETATQQYLSYLRTMSLQESLSRAALSAEWSFASRLAARAPPARKLAPPAFAEIACNQLDRLLKQFQDKFSKLKDYELNDNSEGDEQRYLVYMLCREAQTIYTGSREAALQAAQWARALAARLPPHHNHKARIFDSLMSLCGCLVTHITHILERSRMEEGEPSKEAREARDNLNARVRELLLQVYKLGFEMHKELHRFVTEAPTCRPMGRPTSMASRRARLMRSESIGEEGEGSVLDDIGFKENLAQNNIEALLSEEPVRVEREEGVERCGETSAQEEEWAKRSARAVIEFARCWMMFVVERCDRGRGLRPRWASQGLEFLMLACDPYNTKHLTDEEFEDLKQLMDGCISHVIGSRPAAREPALSPTPAHRHRLRLHSPVSNSSTNSKDGAQSPPTELDVPPVFNNTETPDHSKRVLQAVQELDAARDAQLRERKRVGRVLEAAVNSYTPKLRQLTFKWQRGLKIGAGTFGKVYTVVNTETGQVLAMKELAIGAGDRRALQRAANELHVLEGVLHPHLVRYYGCELHREEMLLFMELCVEGSLEALVATSGALAEHTTRRYTKQLLGAVHELHARSIAHRDIKSGNIFLTNEGHCLKLGDFGCAVKIRANTTAPGELQGFVGTQAYMAPEVFMKTSGHGRAADIWSLGCVVTEMASGKRPFSEYDSNYQIMFVVGMGGRPHIPPTLSEEGRDFCLSCLTHDPEQRPRAETLSLHHFLMVKSDEDGSEG